MCAYINPKLKLNQFKDVRIPSNAEYFARYGFTSSPESQYSGDEESPMPRNKMELYAFMDAWDAQRRAEESNKSD